jgi:flagellar basal-body rod protein FlgF
MSSTGYITLSRQGGLLNEMRVVANNIANASTSGFRQEGVVFSEYVQSVERGSSLSMSRGQVRKTSFEQGTLTQTNGQFDFAIEGDGFFMIQTPQGDRLTRAGSFAPNAAGDLVTNDGHPVLDAGGAPVFVPAGEGRVSVASDGTISVAGQPVGQIGVFVPVDPLSLKRENGVRFDAPGGTEPAENARIVQGFVENSNVDPILQIARMIEVQRAYEMGQSFLETEDQRIREALKKMIR